MNASDYARYQEWKGWKEQPFGSCSLDQSIYFAEELRLSGIESAAGETILEIGFGNG